MLGHLLRELVPILVALLNLSAQSGQLITCSAHTISVFLYFAVQRTAELFVLLKLLTQSVGVFEPLFECLKLSC